MGIVQRQGIKHTILRLAGVLIGVASMLYVYPLNDEIYGYAQFLYNTANFFIPFMSLGAIPLVLKFFPEFNKGSTNNRGFLGYIILLTLALFLLFIGLAWVLKEPFYGLLSKLDMDVEVIRVNEIYILCLAFLLIFIILFINYISNYGRIVIPDLLFNFMFKIFLPIIVLAYVFNKLTDKGVALSLVIFFTVVLIGIIIYAAKLKALKFGWEPLFLSWERIKRMFNFMVFGAFNTIGSSLAFRVDAIMITTLLGATSTGIYFKILIMANVLDIPIQSIMKISNPIISRNWNEGDTSNILDIYKKGSINLLIAGFGIFLVAWFTLENLFAISINPDSFQDGKLIFLFLALGKLMSMLTSVNDGIIVYSKHYRYNLLFILLLGIVNVVLNYILIEEYDIVGAAIASCAALFLFNLVKLSFIYFKFGMSPFSRSTLVLIFVASAVFGILSLIPEISNPFISIIVNIILVVGLYGSSVYYLKISAEVNDLIHKYLKKFF